VMGLGPRSARISGKAARRALVVCLSTLERRWESA
jgi:hypothetical protein